MNRILLLIICFSSIYSYGAETVRVLIAGQNLSTTLGGKVESAADYYASTNRTVLKVDVVNLLDGTRELMTLLMEADGRYNVLLFNTGDGVEQIITSALAAGIEPVWYDTKKNEIDKAIFKNRRVSWIEYSEGDFDSFITEALMQWWTATARNNKSVKRIPLGIPSSGSEFVNSIARIEGVNCAELEIFLPDSTAKPRLTILFFPGGAYQFIGFLRNARELAELLKPHNIAVVGLKYRTRAPQDSTLNDAKRAISYIRKNGSRLGLNSSKIAVLGQSAGANLVLQLCSNYYGWERPDFCGIFSSWNFSKVEQTFVLREDLPPFFIRHATNDPAFELAVKLKEDIERLNPESNTKFVDSGGHGAFELTQNNPNNIWVDEFLEWLSLVDYHTY
ncbi:Xylanase [Mucinivorans hirudinis]|uniref:Xylanase n=1 Tax=Mucinivorans hirudinis TaxID=1433126 RepID=A0A060RBX1_9BACT|nr:Xylanase [Mucinivorans hirudinis]